MTPFMQRLLHHIGGHFPSLVFIGGSALAEFYLGHRFSEDLDFASPSLAAVDRVEGPLDAALRKGGFSFALEIPIRGALVAHVRSGKRGESVKVEISTNPHLRRKPTVRFAGVRIAAVETLMDLKWRALLREELKDVFDLASLRASGIHRHWPREIPVVAASLAHAQRCLADWDARAPERAGWFRGGDEDWAAQVEIMKDFLREYSREAVDFLENQ